MAVNCAAQPATILNPQPTQYPPYSTRSTQQPSPDSSSSGTTPSGTTPSSFSPTLPQNPLPHAHPNLGLQSRQLRPPKCPIYTPAVLRPTEPPSRVNSPSHNTSKNTNMPMTPPQSAGGSIDERLDGSTDDGILRRVLGDGPPPTGVTRIVTDEWNEDALEEVTGLPTKDHWKVRH